MRRGREIGMNGMELLEIGRQARAVLLPAATLLALLTVTGCGRRPAEPGKPAEAEARKTTVEVTPVGEAEEALPLEVQQERWTSVGIGGGGGFFSPAGSPHDPNLVFVSSDMGGFYRSETAGKSWWMLDWRNQQHCGSPVFHPVKAHVMYVCPWGRGGDVLKMSTDSGKTWALVGDDPPWKGDRLINMTIDRGNPGLMLLCGAKALYRSADEGKTWQEVEGSPGGLLAAHVDQTSPGDARVVLAANEAAAFRSDDGGLTWTEKSEGLPWRGIRDFSAGSDSGTGRVVAYVTIPSRKADGKFGRGGVYRTTDRGESWEWAMGAGINKEIGKHEYGAGDIDQFVFLGQAETHPDIIYVTNLGTGYHPPHHFTVYRSEDAGKTWRDVMFNDPRTGESENNTEVGWLLWDRSRGYGDHALDFNVNPGDPNQLFYTNFGEIFISMDGGKSWYQAFSARAERQGKPGKRQRWTSIGLEDTSCWRYVFDPHDRNRTYICYTDIGFARSEDRGETWYAADRSLKWGNTMYQLACDPDVQGLLFAAMSSQHDIPHWRYIQGPTSPGGICISTDYGKTWKASTEGFPPQPTPCTAIVLDPRSPADSRTLYAGVYGHGVFKSTDGGKTWVDKSEGIVPEQNRQVYSVRQWRDGTLFCSVAARRKGRGVDKILTGGLYKSEDGAEHWVRISSDDVFRAVDFAVHPENRDVIYVAAMDGLGKHGGVYITRDGGSSWRLSVPDYDRSACGYIEGYSVALNPANPDVVYFCAGTHGMFFSYNAGEDWEECRAPKCPPFRNCQRIYWDPEDAGTVYIATFGGGIWRGPDPAAPVPPRTKGEAVYLREPIRPPRANAQAMPADEDEPEPQSVGIGEAWQIVTEARAEAAPFLEQGDYSAAGDVFKQLTVGGNADAAAFAAREVEICAAREEMAFGQAGVVLLELDFNDGVLPPAFRDGRELHRIEKTITAGGSPGALRPGMNLGEFIHAEAYVPVEVGPRTLMAFSYFPHEIGEAKIQLNTSKGGAHFYVPENPASDQWHTAVFKLETDAKVSLAAGDSIRALVIVARPKAEDSYWVIDEIVLISHP
ncbi:WD40/YVTN/BNR-like repeat-containing protein [Verrucomicrobiota bacterium]